MRKKLNTQFNTRQYIHVHNAWMSIDLITGIIKEK